MSNELCQLCKATKFKYVCPKCNIRYCSVSCYRSQNHLDCSEKFYKKCIQEELINQASTSKNPSNVKKIVEILQRVSKDEILDESSFLNLENVELDSDDEEEEEDLSIRLKGININDADKLWNTLNNEEKLQFETLIQSGEIVKFVPDFEPWWKKQIPKKMIKNISYNEEEDLKKLTYPPIKTNIADFDKIMKKSPHPNLKFTLSNIFGAYTCAVRYFAGDHLSSPLEATNYLWLISSVFSKNATFDNDEEALKSIIINGQNENLGLDYEDYEVICSDVKKIVDGPFEEHKSDIYKMAALTDLQKMLHQSKHIKPDKEKRSFTQKFANFAINNDLSKDKVKFFIKKIDFFLSYIKSKKHIENIL